MTTNTAKPSRYTVAPFSGPDYQKRSARCPDDAAPCAICGKAIKGEWPHTAIVIEGGAAWGDESSDENDPGHMGAFPVGRDCHKKYAAPAAPASAGAS